MDLVGADGGIEALADREHEFQLVEVGFQRRRHVGILQLAGDLACRPAASRAMDLAQRGGERGLLARTWRTSIASRAPARSPCGGARRPSPWPARWPAAAPARGHIPAAARRGWWRSAGPPSSAGPFRPPSAALRSGGVLVAVERRSRDSAGPPAWPPARRPRRRPWRSGRAGRPRESPRRRLPMPTELSSSSTKPEMTPSPLIPEGGIGGVEAERRQQLLVALHAARLQHVEVLGLKVLLAGLVGGVERVHQAVAEGVGVDVERRMDEVRRCRTSRYLYSSSKVKAGPRLSLCTAIQISPIASGVSSPSRRAIVQARSRNRRRRSGAPPCSACPRPCRRASPCASTCRSRAT